VNRAEAARRRRAAAAARYRPGTVDTLVVVEGPPQALDRYFYFEHVTVHDALFRYLVEVAVGERPDRDKAPWLDEFCASGWFVLDLSEDPFTERSGLPALVPLLVTRCRRLAPRRIILVGAVVYDLAFATLRDAGLPVVDARLPYPGNGQQRRFMDGIADLREHRMLPPVTSRGPWR
jgi:hypothetical protein